MEPLVQRLVACFPTSLSRSAPFGTSAPPTTCIRAEGVNYTSTMSRLAPPQQPDSLRTRRLSTGQADQPGARPQQRPVNGGTQPLNVPSSRNGPPPAASSSGQQHRQAGAQQQQGSGGAGARAQSNVGARLLKKRQSVSYNQAVADGYGGSRGAVPAMPSLPQGMTSNGGAGAVVPSSSKVVPAVAGGTRGDGSTDRLVATGLDVDSLASETFRPEECEWAHRRVEREWLRSMCELTRSRWSLQSSNKTRQVRARWKTFGDSKLGWKVP